jgi:acylphosphatase
MHTLDDSSTIVSAQVIVTGTVQGVFFRVNTKKAASECSVNGWVRNIKGGSVEAVFEGSKENVKRAIEWCKTGPYGAKVDEVKVSWLEKIEGFKSFHIDYESF